MIDHADLEQSQGKFADEPDYASEYEHYLDSLYADREMERLKDREIVKQMEEF
jgi:hypothetical protein